MRRYTKIALFLLSLMGLNIFSGGKDMTIQAVVQSYQEALNRGDTDAIMRLYSKDPVFMPQHASAQVGRDQVRAAYRHVFENIKLQVSFTTHEVETLGNMAYVRTSSAGSTLLLAKGLSSKEGNNELFIFIVENGSWKIHRYLFASNQPPR